MSNEFALFIDGSSLLCTQYYGTEKLNAPTGEPTNGVYGFMRVLAKIIKEQNPTYLAICWDVTRNTFRREMYADYKGNRDESPEDLKSQFILCQKLLESFGVKQFFSKDYEADDYVGTLSKMFENQVDIKIITKDQDYFQCLSEKTHIWKLCNKKKDLENLIVKYGLNKKDMPDKMFDLNPSRLYSEYGYTPDKVVFVKALKGDSSDNIPGILGIGEKSAITLAQHYGSISELYKDLESKTEEEKVVWLKSLKLRKTVLNALESKESSCEGITNKEMGLMSEKLATIKRDIPLNISLNDLKTNINTAIANDELNKLGIKTVKF